MCLKRDLKSMKRGTSLDQREMQKLAAEADPHMVNGMQKTIDAYSGKSDAELMRELRRMTGEQMSRGQLTPEGMDAMAAKIAPMLTEQQRRRMQEVLRQLKGN